MVNRHFNLVAAENFGVGKIKRLNGFVIDIAVFIFFNIFQQIVPSAGLYIFPEFSLQRINTVLKQFSDEHKPIIVEAVAFYEFVGFFVTERKTHILSGRNGFRTVNKNFVFQRRRENFYMLHIQFFPVKLDISDKVFYLSKPVLCFQQNKVTDIL